MESKRHQTFAMNDRNYELGTNQLSLLLSGSYRMNLWEDRIWFKAAQGWEPFTCSGKTPTNPDPYSLPV